MLRFLNLQKWLLKVRIGSSEQIKSQFEINDITLFALCSIYGKKKKKLVEWAKLVKQPYFRMITPVGYSTDKLEVDRALI